MKIFHAFLYFLMGCTAVVLMIFAYWWFIDRNPPLQVQYMHPAPLVSPVSNRDDAALMEIDRVVRGQIYWIYQEYCQKGGIPGVVQTYFVDSIVISLPRRVNIGQKGCFKRSFQFVVPTTVPPARYMRRVTIDYEVNRLRTVRVTLPPVHFEVSE